MFFDPKNKKKLKVVWIIIGIFIIISMVFVYSPVFSGQQAPVPVM